MTLLSTVIIVIIIAAAASAAYAAAAASALFEIEFPFTDLYRLKRTRTLRVI